MKLRQPLEREQQPWQRLGQRRRKSSFRHNKSQALSDYVITEMFAISSTIILAKARRQSVHARPFQAKLLVTPKLHIPARPLHFLGSFKNKPISPATSNISCHNQRKIDTTSRLLIIIN
jgi:hypothetical protein